MGSRHAGLEKPKRGKFGQVDIGFFGTDCDHIRAVCTQIANGIRLSTTYVDADHAAMDDHDFCNRPHEDFGHYILDQGLQSRLSTSLSINDLSNRINHFSNIALINANHFETEQTVWIWNAKKEASARKRRQHRLNCKILVIEYIGQLPSDLKEELPADVQIVHPSDRQLIEKIAALYVAPPLYGLVLAGGKSTRMGYDKTMIAHHEKPQYVHAYDLLSELCETTYLSLAHENHELGLPTLPDRFVGFGPFGAILTAFATHPNVAWMVLAADLPLVDSAHLAELVSQRSDRHVATAFHNPITNFADPLCTIYEPSIYPELLRFLGMGYSCPRKVLINTTTNLITPAHPEKLFNLNTPEDLDKLKAMGAR